MPQTSGYRNQGFDPFLFQNVGFGRMPGQQASSSRGGTASNVLGAASMISPTSVALQAGGGIAKAIADFIGGGQRRKDVAFGRQTLKGQVGKPIFSPSDIAGRRKLSFIQRAGPLAEAANRRLGLGSGRAQQELISQYAGQEGDFLAALIRREAELRSARDVNIGSQFLARG